MVKFREVTPTIPKVINVINFKMFALKLFSVETSTRFVLANA